jgi:hypothetical protein
VVIASANGTEDRAIESRQGVRFLGLQTLPFIVMKFRVSELNECQKIFKTKFEMFLIAADRCLILFKHAFGLAHLLERLEGVGTLPPLKTALPLLTFFDWKSLASDICNKSLKKVQILQ